MIAIESNTHSCGGSFTEPGIYPSPEGYHVSSGPISFFVSCWKELATCRSSFEVSYDEGRTWQVFPTKVSESEFQQIHGYFGFAPTPFHIRLNVAMAKSSQGQPIQFGILTQPYEGPAQ